MRLTSDGDATLQPARADPFSSWLSILHLAKTTVSDPAHAQRPALRRARVFDFTLDLSRGSRRAQAHVQAVTSTYLVY